MHVLIYVAGFLLWPILFGALAGRLLGVEVGPVRGALCGLAGVGVGAVMSDVVTGGVRGAQNFIAYVTFAVLGTLAAIALLDFLVRPATVGRLPQSFGSIPHPVRAVQRRVARGRRYASIISAVRRHGLVSTLSRRNREATIEHVHARERRLGVQLSQVLQEAGGVFVKLGQALSTRPDLLGERAAEQLSVLQDRVAPADQTAVGRLLRAEFGRSPEEVFAWFDAVPLAAASIGQVHRARLHSGPEVAVKIQRPGIEELVERDLDIILALARRLDATGGVGRRVGAADLAQGFAESLRQELDYTIEARNTQVMSEFLERSGIRVPRVFEQFSTRRVLVLEFIDGTPLRDAGAVLANLGIHRADLARRLLETFLAQVLEAGVVNSDPHPGNVLVLAGGTLAQVDFGSVVRLHATQRTPGSAPPSSPGRPKTRRMLPVTSRMGRAMGWRDRVTPDRTAAAIEARRHATGQKLGQVRDAIAWLRRSKTTVTYPAVARRAGVSRTFLYDNPDARVLMEAAGMAHTARRQHDQAEQDFQAEASWRERALNAEDALTAAHAEIRAQRARIGQLLGQLRDAEHELTPDAIQRITTENTTLKQRVRQLTQDNRTLEERLQAARSNNLFADRRIAQLEAQLAERDPAQ